MQNPTSTKRTTKRTAVPTTCSALQPTVLPTVPPTLQAAFSSTVSSVTTGTYYGYVRVSSKDQNELRQILAMRHFGIPEENIVIEKLSGKDFQRPQYQALLHNMHAGDVLVVQSIDRMGRNYEEILEQWRDLTKVRRIAIVVLDMPLLDTRNERDLTGTLVADIVLQLLSYVAQTEREHIRQRQAEGIAAAKERGVKFGREKIPMPEHFAPMVAQWKNRDITALEAATKLGVSRRTFMRRANEYWAAQHESLI